MAFTYPYSTTFFMDTLGIEAVEWDIERFDEFDSQGTGHDLQAELADPKWKATLTFRSLENLEGRRVAAKVRKLDGSALTFMVYDPSNPYPYADPLGIWLDNGSNFPVGGQSVNDQFTSGSYSQEGQAVSGAVAIACVRNLTAYALNSSGVWTAFGANVARVTDLGILVEPAATNLLLQSTTYTNASWGKTTVTPTAVADPAGGTAAGRLTENGSGSVVTQTNVPTTSGQTYTYSRIVKRGNFDWFRITAGDNSFANASGAWFNLATGAIGGQGIVTGTGWGYVSHSIENLGAGWYRCNLSFTPPSGTLSAISSASASANSVATRADVGSGAGIGGYVDAWIAQVEVGSVSTSPILTTTAAVTRPADDIDLDLPPGTHNAIITFDDNTTVAANALTVKYDVPTNFARRTIKSFVVTKTLLTPGLSATVQVNSIGSDGQSLSLKGLPANYKLTEGDKGQINFGTGDVYFFEFSEDKTANGNGVTVEIQVWPHVPLGIAVNQTVILKKAACKMTIVPGGFAPGKSQGNRTGGTSISALERI